MGNEAGLDDLREFGVVLDSICGPQDDLVDWLRKQVLEVRDCATVCHDFPEGVGLGKGIDSLRVWALNRENFTEAGLVWGKVTGSVPHHPSGMKEP